ncbi:MAG: ABC transporter ATP-binding protein [Candidatus Paracaedibacteraceae bacterium]|nr:ABC transporter ATP-binding protein [Candidatus Paracaedibacteraceae bacterium]
MTKDRTEPWQSFDETPQIQIEGITKRFGDFPALRKLDLEIYKGEFFSLLGGSGCGKSTLLRILGGFETPTKGRILIDGVDITKLPPYERSINMMFQSYALFPHMTVEENVAFGLKQENLHRKEISNRVDHYLELVDMIDLRKRTPNQLSGGQRQRIALARCLAKQPRVLLLDEPMAALDKRLREKTQFQLVNIQEKVGITFIMVTHDQEEAMTMSTRIGIMRGGQILQVGTPKEIYEYPNSQYVATFIGNANVLDGVVIENHQNYSVIRDDENECTIYVSPASSAALDSRVHISIRPEKVLISKEPFDADYNTLSGVVTEIAYWGDVSMYHIELPSKQVVQAMVPNLLRGAERPITWDDKVYLHWKPQNGVLLVV